MASSIASTSNGSLERSAVSFRIASIARRFAVVVSQAAGLSGMPDPDPGSHGRGVCLLYAFLGEVQVPRDAHRGGEHPGPLAAVRVGDRRPANRPTQSDNSKKRGAGEKQGGISIIG